MYLQNVHIVVDVSFEADESLKDINFEIHHGDMDFCKSTIQHVH